MHKIFAIIAIKDNFTSDEFKRIEDIIFKYNILSELVTMLQGEARRNNKVIDITMDNGTLIIFA